MKYCKNCNKNKEDEEFYKKSNNSRYLSFMCKSCMSEYQGKRLLNRKIQAIKYKGSKCNDELCNIVYNGNNHYLFDFHHVDPSKKDMDWRKTRLKAWNKCIEELDKCILLCANCHRKAHFNILNGSRSGTRTRN